MGLDRRRRTAHVRVLRPPAAARDGWSGSFSAVRPTETRSDRWRRDRLANDGQARSRDHDVSRVTRSYWLGHLNWAPCRSGYREQGRLARSMCDPRSVLKLDRKSTRMKYSN